ncbi:hypothetical protein [Halalkalibacter akibai]|uniref:hypothetical protein n=1 Tax=Halalkalibacter akibai TaxID=1411 RepID=UPI000ADF3DBC|nr:hypothetical protein [Halalkalibacter akibai]
MTFIEIKLKKCKIYLTEQELKSLLLTNIPLYKESLKRGKSITRTINQRKRESEFSG